MRKDQKILGKRPLFRPGSKGLPSSGTIKLSEIKTEFGKGNNLLSYLGEGGVTSSAPLKLTDFYGKSSSTDISGTVSPSHTGSYYDTHMNGINGATTIFDAYMGDASGNPAFAKIGFLRGSGDWFALEYAAGAGRIGKDYTNMKVVVTGVGVMYDGPFFDTDYGDYYLGNRVNWITTPIDNNGKYSWHLTPGKFATVTLS